MATDVSTAFPWIDLPSGCVLTITLDDAGARITTLNVHGWQAEFADPMTEDNTPVQFAPNYSLGDVAA